MDQAQPQNVPARIRRPSSAKIYGILTQTLAFLMAAASAVFAAATIMQINSFLPRLKLSFEGRDIGFVESKDTLCRALSRLEGEISEILCEPYEFAGDFSYRIELVKTQPTYVSEGELYSLMRNAPQTQSAVATAWGIYIDGELATASESRDDIDKILGEILEQNSGDIGEKGSIDFASDIQVIESQYPRRDVLASEALMLSKLAGAVQFKKAKIETYRAKVPFEVEYVESDQDWADTQTVQREGEDGENLVTVEVTYIGDSEVSMEVKRVETIKEPTAEVVLVGTKPKVPTGKFIAPVRATFTTSLFTDDHRAVDLAAPLGSAVVASDGGIVAYAGSSESYGNYVKIWHSDGFVTLYAHLDSIGVEEGNVLHQGQEIGKCGSTGHSTGPHVHFEIIQDGVRVDPDLYIDGLPCFIGG